MRFRWLLFLTIACAAFSGRTAHAASSSAASHGSGSVSAASVAGHASFEKPHKLEHKMPMPQTGKKASAKRERAGELNGIRSESARDQSQFQAPSGGIQQLDRHASVRASSGLARNGIARDALPVRARTISSFAAPSPPSARHRGANPAIVGGIANMKTRNMEINGTLVSRRP